MNKEVLDVLNKTADNFGETAKEVNKFSKKRKEHSEEAIKYINLCLEIDEITGIDLEKIFTGDIEQRNQDSIVFNTCKILKVNIENQKKSFNELQKNNVFNKEISDKISSTLKDFYQYLEEALSTIQRIIEMDNLIILMDNIIDKRKQFQKESLIKLNELAGISLKNAETAVFGSSSNLERGLNMVNNFKKVEKNIKEKNVQELSNLAQEANRGWNTAGDVNKSSKAQYEFAEKVNRFAIQLHEDSTAIRDMVVHKHHEFEENLQLITVMTVILSIKFRKYLKIEEVFNGMELDDKYRDLLLNFISHVKVACKDIIKITELNFDMTDKSNLNNAIEDKTVHAIKKEQEYFESIKREVEFMTEATRFPVEGSGKNILNGQVLEKHLNEIIAEMKEY